MPNCSKLKANIFNIWKVVLIGVPTLILRKKDIGTTTKANKNYCSGCLTMLWKCEKLIPCYLQAGKPISKNQ